MKRSNSVFIIVFPVLFCIVLTIPMLSSYSQTGVPLKAVNAPKLSNAPAQSPPTELRRINPLRVETPPPDSVLQVAGTTGQTPPIALATGTGKRQEPLDDDLSIDLSNLSGLPSLEVPVPSISDGFGENQGMSFSFDLSGDFSDPLEEIETFPAPSVPDGASRSAPWPANTVTPQNAPPIAQIDPSATVNLPTTESGLLVPPSPEVRGMANQRMTQSLQVTPRVAASQSRQPVALRNQEPLEGTGVPGPRALEGNQSPLLTLEKVAPPEVQVNHPAVLKTIVKNLGQTTAKEIVLRDRIPRGTRLVSTNPKISPSAVEGSDLYWSLGSLAPQEEVAVEMTVIPLVEGEFGSVATLQFASEASGKTVATRAMLDLEISGTPEVLLGEKVTFNLTLTNPGTGTATGVVLELQVPDGLEHDKGRALEFAVGEIKPKETKQYPLTLSTRVAGIIAIELRARADNNLESIAESKVAVLAPDLQLAIAGPRQRFLNHKVAYTLTVANPGTASAHNIDLTATLPSGMKFESTDEESKGIYNEKTHTVHWTLAELPPQEAGEIELVLLPLREGEQTIRLEGIGHNYLKANASLDVNVQGIPSLSFGVAGLTNPVEVGQTATYEVKVLNRGTRAANNVKIHARLSEGMQFASAEGPTRYRSNTGVIQFEPLAILEPKQEVVFRFTAKCLEIGDHRVSVSMSSDELKTPVTKEESTLVYGDQ